MTKSAPMSDEALPRRTAFGPFLWGHRGVGIDIEASCLMYGLRFGACFFGILYKDNPLASATPVSRYRVATPAAALADSSPADADPEPRHADWLRGFADGKRGSPHDGFESAQYHYGKLSGEAERGLPGPSSRE